VIAVVHFMGWFAMRNVVQDVSMDQPRAEVKHL
jgi:hypothetical protein